MYPSVPGLYQYLLILQRTFFPNLPAHHPPPSCNNTTTKTRCLASTSVSAELGTLSSLLGELARQSASQRQFEMCTSTYSKFDLCGHWGIECHHICSKALWEAARVGILRICTPAILTKSPEWTGFEEDEPPNPVEFLGFTGYCSMCVDALKVSQYRQSRNVQSC